MRVEDGFCEASGLKKRKAEQDGVAHARPDGRADFRVHGDALNQNGVNRHADDNEERLKAQRQQGSQIILTHCTPFAVYHCCHRDGRNGRYKVDFNHPPIHDDENADGECPHGKADKEALKPQPEQGADIHCHEPRFEVSCDGSDVDGGIRYDDARRVIDHALRHVKHAHDDVPGVGHDKDGTGRFEYPFEKHPGIHVVEVIFFGDKLNQFQRHNECQNDTRDGKDDVFGQGADHAVYAGVPRLWRRAYLPGYLTDFLIHAVEHAGQVIHDAAD